MRKIEKLFGTLAGASFVGIDTEVVVKQPKNMPGSPRGKAAIKNPQHGRVTKKMTGASVMVFGNTKSNAYENMVKRRLEKEGKDADAFVLSERKWGERIKGTPMVKKAEKDGSNTYYMEVIFLKAGKTEYFLDGKKIAKEDVIGLPVSKPNENAQGGLEDMVQIRTFKLDSITAIRTDGLNVTGPFTFTE